MLICIPNRNRYRESFVFSIVLPNDGIAPINKIKQHPTEVLVHVYNYFVFAFRTMTTWSLDYSVYGRLEFIVISRLYQAIICFKC